MIREIIFYALIAIAIFTTIRNVKIILNYKKNKRYHNIVIKFYDDELSTRKEIDEFLQNTTDQEMYQKALIYKLITTIPEDSYQTILEQIDFKAISFKNNRVNETKINNNYDSFYWYMVGLIKARKNSEIILKLNQKLKEYDYLSDFLYYKLALELSNILLDGNIEHLDVFEDVVKGDVKNYYHDKKSLFFLRHISDLILTYYNQPLSKEDEKLLCGLSDKKLGIYWMNQLELTKYQNTEKQELLEMEDEMIDENKNYQSFKIIEKENLYQAVLEIKNNNQSLTLDKLVLKYQEFLKQEQQFLPVLKMETIDLKIIIESSNKIAIESFVEQFEEFLKK